MACEECVFRDGVRHRLVKLRNAFNPERNWKGPFSSSDEAFWANPEAGSIFQGMSKDKKGYFVLPFEEFSQRM